VLTRVVVAHQQGADDCMAAALAVDSDAEGSILGRTHGREEGRPERRRAAVAENFTLDAQTCDALPEEQMRRLAGDAVFSTGTDDDGGRRFAYRWPGLSVTVHEMPARDVPGHLDGFRGYVRHIYGGQPDERGEPVLDRISHTRLVAGVVVEPARDEQGRAEQVLGSMAYGLHALMFYGSALFDRDSKLILAPDGSFDPDADILGPVSGRGGDEARSSCRWRGAHLDRRRGNPLACPRRRRYPQRVTASQRSQGLPSCPGPSTCPSPRPRGRRAPSLRPRRRRRRSLPSAPPARRVVRPSTPPACWRC
jgi:hypothetical protein